jgi:hypothetical protein
MELRVLISDSVSLKVVGIFRKNGAFPSGD